MKPFEPEAFNAASGLVEAGVGASGVLDREYLFGGNAGVETAGSVPASTDQRAHIEQPDQWYAQAPIAMPKVTMTDPNGRWLAWNGSSPLTISLPDRRDIRSVWFPTSLGVVEIYSGLTEGGTPLYTSNALSECAPIPSGNTTLTLVSANGAFPQPMTVYATSDVLAPSRAAAPPALSQSDLSPIATAITSMPSVGGLTRSSAAFSTSLTSSGELYCVMALLPPSAEDIEIIVALLDIAGTPSGYSLVEVAMGNLTASPASISASSAVPGTWNGAGNTVANALLPPVIQEQTATASGLLQNYIFSKQIANGATAMGGTVTGLGTGLYLPQDTAYLVKVQSVTSDTVQVSIVVNYSS